MNNKMTEHPLLNSLVMNNILEFSTLQDLPSHRLVCKTWFEESLKKWRSTATLSVIQTRSDERQLRNIEEQGQKGKPHSSKIKAIDETGIILGELQKLLCGNENENLNSREFLQLDSKPFKRYRLKQWTIRQTKNDSKNQAESNSDLLFAGRNLRVKGNLRRCKEEQLFLSVNAFPQFWQKIGPLMHHLCLDKVEFIVSKRIDIFNPQLLSTFHHTPNLQSLSLSENNAVCPSGLGWATLSLEMFRIDPTSSNYTFKNGYSPSLINTMSVLQGNNGNGIKLPLRHLTIHHDHRSDDLTLEEELQDGYYQDINVPERLFQLETLKLGTSTSMPEWVQNFVSCLSYILGAYSSVSSLKTLKISMSPFAEPTKQLQLSSSMHFVKHLELVGNCFASLSFLSWMPNLESLRVCISCFERWQEFPQLKLRPNTSPIEKQFVKIFKDDMVHNALLDDTKMKDFIAEKLKHFYIDSEFGLEGLKTLGRWMPNLNELQTILNKETLKVVCEQWMNLETLELLYGSSVDDEGIVENLKFMKNLLTFKLETYCDQSKLGNASATEGFLKMEKLQNLEICVSQKMSADVERELKRKIYNATIIRNYGDNEQSHLTYGKCCKRLQFLNESVKCAKPKPRDITKGELRRSNRLK